MASSFLPPKGKLNPANYSNIFCPIRGVQSNSTFGVTSLFIKTYSKNLKATIVYIDACSSLASESMSDAFLKNGAKTYLGWSDEVAAGVLGSGTYKYPQKIFNDLFSGLDVETAYNNLGDVRALPNAKLLARPYSGKVKLPIFNDDVMPIGNLQGKVYDRCTNQPIVGAVIDIGVNKAVTDVNGQYIMSNVPTTSYDKNTGRYKGNYEAVVDMTKARIAGIKVTGYKDKYNFNINVTFSPAAVSNGAVDRIGNGNFDFVIAKIGQENVCDTIKPTIAQTPMSGPAGTSFAQWGTGFTPNSTATLHFKKPDGTEYPTEKQSIKSDGTFSITYKAPTNKPTGTYKWWAVDSSGKVSNTVSYTITK
jgi:hypothetical protein